LVLSKKMPQNHNTTQAHPTISKVDFLASYVDFSYLGLLLSISACCKA